jgi:hypothetical protein
MSAIQSVRPRNRGQAYESVIFPAFGRGEHSNTPAERSRTLTTYRAGGRPNSPAVLGLRNLREILG